MSNRIEQTDAPEHADILVVPQDARVRERLRARARDAAALLTRDGLPSRAHLESLATGILADEGVDPKHLGFTMVCISNEFWRPQFAAVPPEDRVLLLPHCLRDHAACRGTYDETGLQCAGCGACSLCDVRDRARAAGYNVIIAEGSPAVVQLALSSGAAAMLGVACLDSLEKAFGRLGRLGVPYIAVPLLRDGCVNTEAELDAVLEWLDVRSEAPVKRLPSYRPLLVATQELFKPPSLDAILQPVLGPPSDDPDDLTRATDRIALDWLRRGGKRFRPFMVLASYAALTTGQSPPADDAALPDQLPVGIRRIAVAIEALHKASLVHDDIEDDDRYRYGEETIHRRHGIPTAINVGDYLVGLGYQCVSAARDELGAECVADILAHLTEAHLKLCRGQGAELLALGTEREPRPEEVQRMYAFKTAPAFEAAIYAGVRAADEAWRDPRLLRAYCRYIGVAYQVANDLKDWERDESDKLVAGQDALANRPTLLRALAVKAGYQPREQAYSVQERREAYERLGVFKTAGELTAEYARRALDAADAMPSNALGGFLRFVVETIL